MNQPIAIQQDEQQLIQVLQNSLYPGAKHDSVLMVINYCSSAGLDPMQKPVHIVPMNVKNAQTNSYEWRDVIMPGIGLYRIQADRSGSYAGMSEPEFGEMITQDFINKNGQTVTASFPEWCKITVQKLIGDRLVGFTAKEYWIENYATDSGKSTAPNAMWLKRPRGQINKCCEAQALRKGWPEIGAQPTAEEMEGKESFDVPEESIVSTQEKTIELYPQDEFDKNLPKWKEHMAKGHKTANDLIGFIESKGRLLTEPQKTLITGEAV